MLIAALFSLLVIVIYLFWPVIVIFIVSLLPVANDDNSDGPRFRRRSTPPEIQEKIRPKLPGKAPKSVRRRHRS